MERLVDARGMLCPKPLILTKKALMSADQGDTLKISSTTRRQKTMSRVFSLTTCYHQ